MKKISTEIILHSISKNFQFLFDCYSCVEYNWLKNEEFKLENFDYNVNDPLVVVEDLMNSVTTTKLLKSQQQIITYDRNIWKEEEDSVLIPPHASIYQQTLPGIISRITALKHVII